METTQLLKTENSITISEAGNYFLGAWLLIFILKQLHVFLNACFLGACMKMEIYQDGFL